jgi:hypothetical protein
MGWNGQVARMSKGKKVSHEDVWGSGGIVPSFLTSALDGSGWSATLPWPFNPPPHEKSPSISTGEEAERATETLGLPDRSKPLYRLSYPSWQT